MDIFLADVKANVDLRVKLRRFENGEFELIDIIKINISTIESFLK